MAALNALHAAESKCGDDPAALATARAATAAAMAGDTATVEAAGRGDLQAAVDAAEAWHRRQERDARDRARTPTAPTPTTSVSDVVPGLR